MNKAIVKRVEELEEKYRVLADNLIDAIWVLDVETMSYDYITSSIQRISGFAPEELIGVPVKSRMPEKSYEKIVEIMGKAIEAVKMGDRPIRTMEIEMVHKNGNPYWIEVRAKIIKEDNSPLKIIGITRDITKEKIHEQKQLELINKMSVVLAEKEKLLQENKILRAILPICSGCKRIRDEKNRWWPLDIYVQRHTHSDLTHTICPDCKPLMYEDF